MTKSFHAGTAAQNGIIAASLAKEGFTADDSILEATQGYCQMFSPNYELDKITQGLGSPFSIISPGLSFKAYPCCHAAHYCIDATLYLNQEHDIKAADVAEVQCRTLPYVPIQMLHHQPKTGLEGKFSLEYFVAVALLDRDVKLAQFEDERVNRSDVQELLLKVKYIHPEEMVWNGVGMRPPPVVTVRLKDGREFSHKVQHPKGEPGNPLTQEELVTKFRDCACEALSAQDTERCVEMVSNMESLKDVSPLMDILTSAKG